MADFSKPTDIPRWADTGVIVTPSDAKQDSGWVAPELPPDTYFNWHQNLTGLWVKWLDERMDDGGDADTFRVHGPDLEGTDVDGGTLNVEGGAATGDGASDVVFSAVRGSQGAGATVRSAEEFMRLDGSTDIITAIKTIQVLAPGPDNGIVVTGGPGGGSGALLIGGGSGTYGADVRGSSAGGAALKVRATLDNEAILVEPPAASPGASSHALKADWSAESFVTDMIELMTTTVAGGSAIKITADGPRCIEISTDGASTNAIFVEAGSSATQYLFRGNNTGASGGVIDALYAGSLPAFRVTPSSGATGAMFGAIPGSVAVRGIDFQNWTASQKAPLSIGGTAEPASPHLVGDMYVTTGGVLKICTVAGSPGTFVTVGTQSP